MNRCGECGEQWLGTHICMTDPSTSVEIKRCAACGMLTWGDHICLQRPMIQEEDILAELKEIRKLLEKIVPKETSIVESWEHIGMPLSPDKE